MKKLPLEGVRVADLTMMWAGPFATRVLGEMGAEIIKIESPRAWDNIRTLIPQPGAEDPWNSSYYFNFYYFYYLGASAGGQVQPGGVRGVVGGRRAVAAPQRQAALVQ